MNKIYANALLSDNKILFWRTAQRKYEVTDFYKDFSRSGIKQSEYEKEHELKVATMAFEFKDENINNFVFDKIAKVFYSFWEISPDSKGEPAYKTKGTVLDIKLMEPVKPELHPCQRKVINTIDKTDCGIYYKYYACCKLEGKDNIISKLVYKDTRFPEIMENQEITEILHCLCKDCKWREK